MHSVKRDSKFWGFKTLAMLLTVLALLGASVSTRASTSVSSGKAAPAFPAKPITLQIIDVSGQSQLTRGMIDNYVKANPDKVSNVEVVTETAPKLPGRINAQNDDGKIDTALVLTG